MRFNIPLRYAAVGFPVCCFGLLIAGAAQASILQSQSFAGTYTVTDTTANGVAVTGTSQFGAPTFSTFETSLGVLTKVIVRVRVSPSLGESISQTTAVSGTSARFASSLAKNTLAIKLTAPGISGATVYGSHQNLSCTSKAANGYHCLTQVGPKKTSKTRTFIVGPSNLAGYTSAAGSTVTAPLVGTLSANDTLRHGSFNSTSDQYTVSLSGDERVAYYYDQHSDASFDSKSKNSDVLTLDFGTVLIGSDQGALGFDIFNRKKTDHHANGRIGLDYNAAASGSSGDTGVFSFDNPWSIIQDLAAGYSDAFKVHFNTGKSGAYSAIYTIGLTDTRDVAGFGYADNTLTLRIVGNVVPEPGTLALIFGGAVLLGGIGLRRRRKV
jgi:hypothetical protein